MDILNHECPCKHVKCKNHGNCTACREKHHSKEREIPTACEKAELKAKRKAERGERHNKGKI